MTNPDKPIRAAGVAYCAPSGRALFLKRSAESDHAGEWCFPGGGIEEGETPEQAIQRESREEIGTAPEGTPTVLSEDSGVDGVRYTTYRQKVPAEFEPRLNDEHTDHIWAPMSNPPEPLHPGVRKTLTSMALDAAPSHDRLAFDKGSVRSVDRDGRLHVEVTNISKACVNPYLGREIPDSDALGLEPGKVYKLLRDPDELEKSADTFNNLPLLSAHKPVNAEDHAPELVVGASGSDAVFAAPYLKNSIVVWSQDAIDGIESGEAKELSCAYRYRAVMTPGTYQGEPYDGRMVDLIGNHIALVSAGRAGPDVVVGDQLPEEIQTMIKKAPSRMAVLARGALLALTPKLATDQKLDLATILEGVTRANWKERKAGIVSAVQPKLAQDIDPKHVVHLLDSLDSDADAPPAAAAPNPADANLGTDDDDGGAPMPDADADASMDAIDADPCAEILEILKGKLSPEDYAAIEAKIRALTPAAADADPDSVSDDPTSGAAPADGGPPFTPGTPAAPATSNEDKTMITKPAMDAAIAAVRKQAVTDGRKLARDIAEAEAIVKPFVGSIVAQDSAEDVYKAALSVMGVKTEGIHPSAYRAILEAQPKPDAGRSTVVAMDAKTVQSVATRFPDLGRINKL